MEGMEWEQGALRRNAGDAALRVRFEVLPRKDEAASLLAGRPVFKDVEYIRIAVPGNRIVQVHRPVRPEDKQRFARAWEHWTATRRNVVDGTPLAEWPPLTRSQVEELVHFNVTTVEQLAAMPEGAAGGFHGGLALKQKAQDFLAKAKDGAHMLQMREELAKRDNEAEVLRRQMAEQKAALEALQALVSEQGQRTPGEQDEPTAQRRGPGRPPKVQPTAG